jgi:molybdopterin-guanine dinucleotide biosynthesis protein A
MEATPAPVVILAGGKSSRLGRDKASELLAGRTLLQRAVDACEGIASRYVLVKARGQALPVVRAPVPVDTLEDAYPETGPLGGIYTGLVSLGDSTGDQVALVLACDMPLLQPAMLGALLRLALGYDAVVPVRDGLPEPLCAAYAPRCAEAAGRLLDGGAYKLAGLLDRVRTRFLDEAEWQQWDAEGLSFLNVNREEDLARARVYLERSPAR